MYVKLHKRRLNNINVSKLTSKNVKSFFVWIFPALLLGQVLDQAYVSNTVTQISRKKISNHPTSAAFVGGELY